MWKWNYKIRQMIAAALVVTMVISNIPAAFAEGILGTDLLASAAQAATASNIATGSNATASDAEYENLGDFDRYIESAEFNEVELEAGSDGSTVSYVGAYDLSNPMIPGERYGLSLMVRTDALQGKIASYCDKKGDDARIPTFLLKVPEEIYEFSDEQFASLAEEAGVIRGVTEEGDLPYSYRYGFDQDHNPVIKLSFDGDVWSEEGAAEEVYLDLCMILNENADTFPAVIDEDLPAAFGIPSLRGGAEAISGTARGSVTTRLVQVNLGEMQELVLYVSEEGMEEKEVEHDFSSYITTASVLNGDAEPITKENPVKPGDKIEIKWEFKIPNEDLAAFQANVGSIYSFDYEEFGLAGLTELAAPISGERWYSAENAAGDKFEYQLTEDGMARLRFLSLTGGNISGGFIHTLEVSEHVSATETEIDLEVGGITIPIYIEIPDRPGDVTVEKSGEYEKEYNRIVWTITVTPKYDTLDGVTVTDQIDNRNLEWMAGGSTGLLMWDTRNISDSLQYDEDGRPSGFEFTFPEGTTGVQTLTLTTLLEDGIRVNMTDLHLYNRVAVSKIDSQGTKTELDKANAEVVVPSGYKSFSLEKWPVTWSVKTPYDLEWIVQIRPGEVEKESLKGIVVTDRFDESAWPYLSNHAEDYVLKSVKLLGNSAPEVETTLVQGIDYELLRENGQIVGFTYTENADVKNRLRLVLSMKITEKAFEDTNGKEIKNKAFAELTVDGNTSKKEISASVHVNAAIITKTGGEILRDSDGQPLRGKLSYQAEINPVGLKLTDLVLTDTLPTGTWFGAEDTISFKSATGEALELNPTISSENGTLDVRIPKLDQALIMTYTISYDPENLSALTGGKPVGTTVTFVNRIDFEGKGPLGPITGNSTVNTAPSVGALSNAIPIDKQQGAIIDGKLETNLFGANLVKHLKELGIPEKDWDNVLGWRIKIGEVGKTYEVEDLVLTDTMTETTIEGVKLRQEYLPGSLRLMEPDGNGKYRKAENQPQVSFDPKNPQVVSCTFNGTIKGGSYLTLLARISDIKLGTGPVKFKNTVVVGDITDEAEGTWYAGRRIWKTGTYNGETGAFRWEISLNQNGENKYQILMRNPVVTDTLPVGHELIKESDGSYAIYLKDGTKIYTASELAKNPELQSSAMWKAEFLDKEGNPLPAGTTPAEGSKVRLSLNEKKTDAKDYINLRADFYLLTRMTSEYLLGLAGTDIQNVSATNKVGFTADNVVNGTGNTAEATVKNTVRTPIKKDTFNLSEAEKNSGMIGWEAILNQNLSQDMLAGAVLTDVVPEGLAVDLDSVEVYMGAYRNNKLELGENLPAQYYQTAFDFETRTFTVEFQDTIPGGKAVVVHFKTYATASDAVVPGKPINNTITLTGKGMGDKILTSETTYKVGQFAWITSNAMRLKLQKKGEQNETLLTGAKYKVWRASDKTEVYEAVTDKNGVASFVKKDGDRILTDIFLPGQKYLIQEMEAPQGYYRDPAEIPVTMPDELDKDGKPIILEHSVTVKDTARTAKVVKLDDASHDPIPGVQMELIAVGEDGSEQSLNFVEDGSSYRYTEEEAAGNKTLVTDTAGTILVTGLPAGDYYFLETKAADGYEDISDENVVKTDRFTLEEDLPDGVEAGTPYCVVAKQDGNSYLLNTKKEIPDPDPEPTPDPDPTPTPDPDPTPMPDPDPTPTPNPDPTPTPNPDPTPTPDPGPAPTPDPGPTPTPDPGPTPTPNPGPAPTPTPEPTPSRPGNSGGGHSGGNTGNVTSNGTVITPGTVITDQQVPLAAMPAANAPEPEQELVTLMDEDVPLAGLPKTGDKGTRAGWYFLLSALLLGCGAMRRRRKEE